jgi:hypothetical protein
MTRTIFEEKRAIRCAVSVDHDEFPQPQSGAVRGRLNISGWYAEQVGDGKLFVMYLNHSNPGGWIPGWIVNSKLSEYVSRTYASNNIGSKSTTVQDSTRNVILYKLFTFLWFFFLLFWSLIFA